jgi:hypothetical protein
MILEVSVEDYLVEQTELHGAICEKHVSPGRKGPPDRIVLWPLMPPGLYPEAHFIETKCPDGVVKPWQKRDHTRRRALGFSVFVIWSKEQVDFYIHHCYRNGLWRS